MSGRWQGWINVILGVWLFVSPWLLGFTGYPSAAWNAYILGIVIAAVAAASMTAFPRLGDWAWVNIILGIWMVVSPWVLGFAQAGDATWNAVIVGVLVLVVAGWRLAVLQRPVRGGA